MEKGEWRDAHRNVDSARLRRLGAPPGCPGFQEVKKEDLREEEPFRSIFNKNLRSILANYFLIHNANDKEKNK